MMTAESTDPGFSWQLIPVLHDCYTESVSSIEIYVSTIQDSKSTGRILTTLNSKFPNSSLLHLKRVNSVKSKTGANELKVILAISESMLSEVIEFLKVENLWSYLGEPHVVLAPSANPKTRNQFQEAMKLWPLSNFCADKYIEKILSDELFSNQEKKVLENLMRICLKCAEKSVRLGGKGVGCVIAQNGKVLATGCDARNLHPLKHATMAAIDMIAWIKQSQTYSPPSWIGGDEICEFNSDIVTGPEEYLCTNYDVFLTREPCTMCAMALLHNRVKRIFYGCNNEIGALGTLFKLHTTPDINHRYEVFGGILAQECNQIISSDIKNETSNLTHVCFR